MGRKNGIRDEEYSRDGRIDNYVSRYGMDLFLNREMLEDLRLFRFPAYTRVFLERDNRRYLYFLVEGQTQCSYYHMNGKLAVMALLDPFTAIGDFEILSDSRRNSDVDVITTRPVVLLGLAEKTVERFGAEDPKFLRFLIDQLREKIYTANALQMNRVLPAVSRLALYLLAQRPAGDRGIILPDKESFASLLGTTERHLNRVLRSLEDSGGIGGRYPVVRILDRKVLISVVEE